MVHLDSTAWETLRRFGLKVGVAALVASLGKTSFILAASGWLALYGLVTVVMAVLLSQPFLAKSFNHWDEATWLTTASLGLWVVHKTWP